MTRVDEYQIGLDEFRKCADEYEDAVDDLVKLAESRGQGDPSFPLVVSESDTEMRAAIDREVAASRAMSDAMQRLRTLRSP